MVSVAACEASARSSLRLEPAKLVSVSLPRPVGRAWSKQGMGEMTLDQGLLFAIMGCVFALLLWGRIRYDVVAFGALVAALVVGAVPVDQAFSGFGHPATVIIALVLIASRGLQNSGAIELIARYVVDASRSLMAHISLIGVAGAILSSFMNNVAALALLMPVDMQAANKANRSPALTLMPLSFATILGGMVTLIGTPPNIVVDLQRRGVGRTLWHV